MGGHIDSPATPNSASTFITDEELRLAVRMSQPHK
ncbi:hypothetical protein CBM2592_A280110 [Cupriavidus taiwanensis]|nr:hypothetical protein CBM2592_A280110 [Cupriavidus taiwanensis]SOY85754.1 hypothetical protein CBM2591_A320110 [Cupriavidus taiwanensis]SPA15640.1 hypothetical protein CBM2631_A320013 [Cupriavidus taiwanensis]